MEVLATGGGRTGEPEKTIGARWRFCNEILLLARQELAAVSLNPVEYQPITNHAYNGNREPVSTFPGRPSCKL
jgi:hypothetical protein